MPASVSYDQQGSGAFDRNPDGTYAQLVKISNALEVIRTGAITTNNVAQELKVEALPLEGREQILLYPPTTGKIYWGASNVTAANGAPLAAGDPPVQFMVNNNDFKVYVVSDGTNREIRVVESK